MVLDSAFGATMDSIFADDLRYSTEIDAPTFSSAHGRSTWPSGVRVSSRGCSDVPHLRPVRWLTNRVSECQGRLVPGEVGTVTTTPSWPLGNAVRDVCSMNRSSLLSGWVCE